MNKLIIIEKFSDIQKCDTALIRSDRLRKCLKRKGEKLKSSNFSSPVHKRTSVATSCIKPFIIDRPIEKPRIVYLHY